MDKTWKEVAGVGTSRRSLDNLSHESQTDKLREGLAKGQNELRLLAGAGLAAIESMAGYVPPVDNLSLPMPDEVRPSVPFKETAIRHLVLLHQGYNSPVYLEWLHWASMSKAAIPLEAIPLILDLASQFHVGKEMTKWLVGARGRWIVRQGGSSRWQWINRVEIGKPPRLGKQKKQEERVIALFRPHHYYQMGSKVREELRLLQFPWSLRFSELLLETIVGVMTQFKHWGSTDLIDIIALTKYWVHPHIRQAFIQTFEDYSTDPEVLKAVDALGRLLEFRLELREGFGILD